jgi:hypothetical protein
MISLFDVLNLFGITLVSTVLGYTTFWALSIRKVLAIRAYRHQALGIALISLTLALDLISNTVSAYLIYNDPGAAIGQGGFGFFFVFLVVLFYWIDSSVVAAKRSDPLGRDFLHWSKLRVIFWIGTLPTAILVTSFDIYSLVSMGGRVTGGPPGWAVFLLIPGIFIPPITGIVLLPFVRRRTPDPTLKKHLKWFGLFALAYLILTFPGNQPDVVMALFYTYLGSIISAYCLYRSVLSLTPTESRPT